MFTHFLADGSVFSVFLMEYALIVMCLAQGFIVKDRLGLYTPPIIRSGFGALILFCSIPCVFWPAIYIGMFDGWFSGVVAWGGLQLVGVVISVILRFLGPVSSLTFLVGFIAYLTGYYLSFNHLP